MLSEEQYNKVKKQLKKKIKQYAIAEKLKVSKQEVQRAKEAPDYYEYIARNYPKKIQVNVTSGYKLSGLDNLTVPKQEEIPFYSTEDLYKLLIEIRDSVEELHARQGV